MTLTDEFGWKSRQERQEVPWDLVKIFPLPKTHMAMPRFGAKDQAEELLKRFDILAASDRRVKRALRLRASLLLQPGIEF